MIAFKVDDMSCGHCVGSITAAAKSVDRDAGVNVDLATKRVEIDSATDAGLFKAAIEQAGYTPVSAVPTLGSGDGQLAKGSCCGGRP